MMNRIGKGWLLGLAALVSGAGFAQAHDHTPVDRGRYLYQAAGACGGCHTDRENKGPELAGGRTITTPYGKIYSPNITPDPATGIGKWTKKDFLKAIKNGKGKEGQHLFPVFPYPAYAAMKTTDLDDLWAFLQTAKPVKKKNRPHEIEAPFGWRFGLMFWKILYFSDKPFPNNPKQSPAWNRGAYLVNTIGGCAECHTARNSMGGLKMDEFLGGSDFGPKGKSVPNITPHKKNGIGKWTQKEIVNYVWKGKQRNGKHAHGMMGELIRKGFKYLKKPDALAIAEYLVTVKPVDKKIIHKMKKKKNGKKAAPKTDKH